jgi:thioredoxin-related protein
VVLAAAASANPGDDGHLASDQQTSTSSSGYHLILYSKPNCSLCDGLKVRRVMSPHVRDQGNMC